MYLGWTFIKRNFPFTAINSKYFNFLINQMAAVVHCHCFIFTGEVCVSFSNFAITVLKVKSYSYLSNARLQSNRRATNSTY